MANNLANTIDLCATKILDAAHQEFDEPGEREAFDGDTTEKFSKLVLLEMDLQEGNITMDEYTKARAKLLHY